MRIEITIDCVDDTKRIPQGQVIQWIVKGDKSRDYRMREVGQLIANTLKKNYPGQKDGRKLYLKGSGIKDKEVTIMPIKEYFVALETNAVDKTIKQGWGKIFYNTGRTEMVDLNSKEFLERTFDIGAKDN